MLGRKPDHIDMLNKVLDPAIVEGNFTYWSPKGRVTLQCTLLYAKHLVNTGAMQGGTFVTTNVIPQNRIYL